MTNGTVEAAPYMKRKHCIHLAEGKRHLYFCASSEVEMNDWLQAIQSRCGKKAPKPINEPPLLNPQVEEDQLARERAIAEKQEIELIQQQEREYISKMSKREKTIDKMEGAERQRRQDEQRVDDLRRLQLLRECRCHTRITDTAIHEGPKRKERFVVIPFMSHLSSSQLK